MKIWPNVLTEAAFCTEMLHENVSQWRRFWSEMLSQALIQLSPSRSLQHAHTHTNTHSSSSLRDFSRFKIDSQLPVLPFWGWAGGVACRWGVLPRRGHGHDVCWAGTGWGGVAAGGLLVWLTGHLVLGFLRLVPGDGVGGAVELSSFLVLLIGRDSLLSHLSMFKKKRKALLLWL